MASSARIDELRKKFDENPRRYFAPLANEFRKAGDPEQAVFICQEYLPQQPGHMSGHIVYGQALFELGRDEEAKAVFETALSLDPENLIALRHLGDIARQAGDLDVARFWYQRVLESDPRNDEIAQILMGLDAARDEAARPAVDEPPPVPVSETLAPTIEEHVPALHTTAADATAPDATETLESESVEAPASEPVEVPSAAAEATEPESYEPFEGFDRTIDFEQPPAEPIGEPEALTGAQAGGEAPFAGVPQTEQEPPVAATQSTQPDDHELLDLDDFSIGGTPLNVPTVAEQTEAPEARAGEPAEVPAIEFSQSEAPLNLAVPSADAAEPEITSTSFEEPAPDEAELDALEEEALFGEDQSRTTFEPERPAAATPAAATASEVESEPVIELATDIALGLPPDEPEPPAVEPEPDAEPAVVDLESAAAAPVESLGEAEPMATTESESTEEVFVTETMANLYVQQGHLASALEIYEKLLTHQPDDVHLQARIREIKEHIYGKPHETVWEPEPAAATLVGTAPGPTIREYLQGVIAARAARATSNGAAPDGEPDGAPAPDSPADTVTGSIDALFANAEPSEEDRTAADALAHAFGDWPAPTPIRGVPAHEAASELSLDHVFKANSPAPRRDDADAFSLDQFFSDGMDELPGTTQDQSGRGPAESSDDIAQFNAWLNGLKKT